MLYLLLSVKHSPLVLPHLLVKRAKAFELLPRIFAANIAPISNMNALFVQKTVVRIVPGKVTNAAGKLREGIKQQKVVILLLIGHNTGRHVLPDIRHRLLLFSNRCRKFVASNINSVLLHQSHHLLPSRRNLVS